MTSTDAVEGRRLILDVLGALWQAIQQQHDQVPDTLFTWATGGRRGRTSGVPHLHGGDWSGELTITDQHAAEPGKLADAVLHEAVHALAAARGIADTSNNGKYHNHRYAKLAEELGLETTEHAEHARWGWSETTPTEATLAHYEAEIGALRAAAERYIPDGQPTPTGRGRNNVVAVCGCAGTSARPIRIAPTKLGLGPITCGICGQDYRERVAAE